MFTVENSILLPAPLARVWRLVFDVNRYRDWHPDIGLESDPNDPKKLIYTYWRPGWADHLISVEGSIVRLKRPSAFAWRVGIRWLFEIEEGFHLEKAPQGTRLTHRLSCSGIGSRSEERRVGKECVSTCRSRWSRYDSERKPHSKPT